MNTFVDYCIAGGLQECNRLSIGMISRWCPYNYAWLCETRGIRNHAIFQLSSIYNYTLACPNGSVTTQGPNDLQEHCTGTGTCNRQADRIGIQGSSS